MSLLDPFKPSTTFTNKHYSQKIHMKLYADDAILGVLL